MADVAVMLPQTLRPWARGFHQHVMDHGGAIVRGYAMEARDVVDEDIDVLITDDITSYLSPGLVADLRERGVGVIGMYDEADGDAGRSLLLGAGVDVALSADTPPELLLAELVRLSATLTGLERSDFRGDPASSAARHVVAVASAGGGCGATEVALAFAEVHAERGCRVVLVDSDDQSPGLGYRLRLAPAPNLRMALDTLSHRSGPVSELPRPGPRKGLRVLPGITSSADWSQLRPDEVLELLSALGGEIVVANVGGRVEELPGIGRLGRFGVARTVVASAATRLLVSTASPRGIILVAEWAAALRGVVRLGEVHVVLNRHAGGRYTAAELAWQLQRFGPRSITVVPYDRRVLRAEWDGELVDRGPFRRAIESLVDATHG